MGDNDEDELQDLIAELKRVQLRGNDIVQRIADIQASSQRSSRREQQESSAALPDRPSSTGNEHNRDNSTTVHELRVGDTVVFKGTGSTRGGTGRIVGFTTDYVKIQRLDGNPKEVRRKVKNVTKLTTEDQ